MNESEHQLEEIIEIIEMNEQNLMESAMVFETGLETMVLYLNVLSDQAQQLYQISKESVLK